MKLYLPLFTIFFCLLCGPAIAEDYYITHITDDADDLRVYAVPPLSIIDLGEGVKRTDLLSMRIFKLEEGEEGSSAYADSYLSILVIEVKCQANPRQWKKDSEIVYLSRDLEPIDKSGGVNSSKDWGLVPSGSFIEAQADFICQWPEIRTESVSRKYSAASRWDFMDKVSDSFEKGWNE